MADKVTKQKYFLTAGATLDIKEFDDVTALQAELIKLREAEIDTPTNTKVLVMQGERLFLSKGYDKYLLLPDGSRLPIFNTGNSAEPDDEGLLTNPLLPKPPKESKSSDPDPDYAYMKDDFDMSDAWPDMSK